MTIALRQRPLARVVQGIVAAANGAWFDPSDMSTLYQDAAGTTPVTAVEQPVGLMLDKSQGLMLGPELVSNGTFDADTSWTKNTGVTISAGTCNFLAVTNGYGINQSISQPLSIVKKYLVEFEVSAYSSGGGISVRLGNSGSFYATTPSNGKKKLIINAGSTSGFVQFLENSGSGSYSIDNISVRELYGYHATQSITASRPTLSARYNLLTKTEDFSDAVWTKSGITLSQALGPNGVTGAYKITEDLTTGTHSLSQAVSSSASSYIVYIKNDGANYCAVSWRGNSSIRYDVVIYNLLTKSKIMLQDASGLYVSDSIVDIGDGWLKITITLKSAAQFHVACANPTKDPSYLVIYTGDGVSGLIVYHPQVSPSVTTPYQRVNTATDYDTDERYFKKYLRFDGVDDYLNLPYMGLYAGGSASVVVARDELTSQSTTHSVSEGSSVNNSRFYCLTRSPSGYVSINPLIRTDSAVDLTYATLITGSVSPLEVRSVVDSGSTLTGYKNTVRGAPAAYSRSGSTITLDTTLVGALNYGGVVTDFSNMKLYGLIITKSALTDAQRIKCERYLATKAGLSL